MKQIIVMIIKKTELLNHELVDLIVASVRKENKERSSQEVAEEVCSPLMETIPTTTDMSKLREEASRKRKLECLDGSRIIPVSFQFICDPYVLLVFFTKTCTQNAAVIRLAGLVESVVGSLKWEFPLVAWTNERPLENKELNAIIGAWFTLWRD
ncbi:hypothetical protein Tco_0689753 [Tanacetum coccineum]